MLLSDADTKTKWCPYGRGLVELQAQNGNPIQIGSANRTGAGEPTTACIGSACMAWRWAGWRISLGTVAPHPDDEDKIGPRLGYCGLAGKPYGTV